MKNNSLLTRVLAILGAMLVLFPLLAPVVLSVARLIEARRFLFDYLMPAEFFPLVLIGGFLLMLAAIRMRKYRALIGWGLGARAAPAGRQPGTGGRHRPGLRPHHPGRLAVGARPGGAGRIYPGGDRHRDWRCAAAAGSVQAAAASRLGNIAHLPQDPLLFILAWNQTSQAGE